MAPPKSKLTEAQRKERNKRYCKKYRQTHKERYQLLDAERKSNEQTKLKLMNPELYRLKKADDRERAKLYRLRKKCALVNTEIVEQVEEQDLSTVSFRTKQSLNRSVHKVEKALPCSPRKFFLNRSDITYMNPGRKDNVYVGKINGERAYVQKRFLLWTIRDIVDIANGINGEVSEMEFFSNVFESKLTFVPLYNFLKSHKQYIFNRDIPHSSCLCEICENSVLMAKGISKSLTNEMKDVSLNPHDIVEQYSCHSDDEKCMTGECDNCKSPYLQEEDFEDVESGSGESGTSSEKEDESVMVSFHKWGRQDGKVIKQYMRMEACDAVKLWDETVTNLKIHIHYKRRQVIKTSLLYAMLWSSN